MSAAGKRTAQERREAIVRILNTAGYASIGELSERLKVSEMTIRRDLDTLAGAERVRRSHGGASLPPAGPGPLAVDLFEPDVAARVGVNREAKAQIGRAAAALVRPQQTVALDIGSTTLACADTLRDVDVQIFTNSLKIALHLRRGKPRVYVPGGEIRGNEPSAVGALARSHLAGLRFDWLMLGASGASPDGLYDYSLEDTEIKRALIARADRTVALIDSSKFNRMSIVKVCDLDALDILISDAPPPDVLRGALAAAGVDVRAENADIMQDTQ